MDDQSTGGQFSGGAAGSASWDGFPELPPQPFPQSSYPDFPQSSYPDFPHRRFPDFPLDYYRAEDRFATPHNEGFLRNNEGTAAVRNYVKSCFFVSAAFSFFVSMCMAFGLYGSETLTLGSNTSTLINPNHLFVESVQVAELDASKGLMLYGFDKTPALDGTVAWSETHNITLPSDYHREWVYYLNTGSVISINYTVDSPSPVVLAIVEGDEGLAKWLEDPSNPKTAVTWNIIYGKGLIQRGISKSSSYYIAFGNLNTETVKMDLNMSIKAFLYNTTESYYTCAPAYGECNFKLFWLGGNTAVLSSPARLPGMSYGDWHVTVRYGPRWMTYLLAIGSMITLLVLFNYCLNRFQRTRAHRQGEDQVGASSSERNPLISQETDKHSSRSSSGSALEDAGFVDYAKPGFEKPVPEEEEESRRLCAICFDDPKDCFFFPCGHSVSCYGCATRVLEASGSCPVCRQHIKKVRKIITV